MPKVLNPREIDHPVHGKITTFESLSRKPMKTIHPRLPHLWWRLLAFIIYVPVMICIMQWAADQRWKNNDIRLQFNTHQLHFGWSYN